MFCDALHLDQAVLPVSRVVRILTGAQRVITQGKITALIYSITKKCQQAPRASLLREMLTPISVLPGSMGNCNAAYLAS